MFCPTCGIALSHQMKYCNRCGAHLTTTEDAALSNAAEKRLDNYLDGLFWITLLGLGFILGGIALLKKIQVSDGLLIAFVVLSFAAFLVNFGLSFREVQRLKRAREPIHTPELEPLNSKELGPASAQASMEGLPSVTENTTRELQSRSREKIAL
jgi:hypothetical protein